MQRTLLFLITIFIFFSCKKESLDDFNSPKGRVAYVLNKRIKKKETFKVAVIGGSITAGSGVSDYADSYAVKFQKKLSAELNREVEMFNHGVGASTSTLGMFRMNNVFDNHPDLVIVEFAVNDGDLDSVNVLYNHENIFRKCYDLKIPVVSLNLNVETGETSYARIMKVIERHKVPDVRVVLGVGDYTDGIHPNSTGHEKIASQLFSSLIEIKNNGSDEAYVFPSPLVNYDFDKASLCIPNLPEVSWSRGDIKYISNPSYYSTKTRDTLNLKFYGNRIGVGGLFSNQFIQNSRLYVQVDNLPKVKLEYYFSAYQLIKSDIIATDLSNSIHSLQLIFEPIDEGLPVRHEIIDFMVAGYGNPVISIDPAINVN